MSVVVRCPIFSDTVIEMVPLLERYLHFRGVLRDCVCNCVLEK